MLTISISTWEENEGPQEVVCPYCGSAKFLGEAADDVLRLPLFGQRLVCAECGREFRVTGKCLRPEDD